MRVQDLAVAERSSPAPVTAPNDAQPWVSAPPERGVDAGSSVLEKLQACRPELEIWWDSSPLDFPAERRRILAQACDPSQHTRWATQLDRFLHWGEARPPALVRGITTNPSLITKSVLASADFWTAELREQARRQSLTDVGSAFWLLYREAVRRAATAMLPMWQDSDGRYGWVSGQLDPRLMFDADGMYEQALQLARLSPNLMVKVPGTEQGYRVVRRLAARGVSTNGTLSYTMPQFTAYIEAVETGLAQGAAAGVNLTSHRAVVTHMIGRLGSHGDLRDEATARGIPLSQQEVRWAEVAVLKRVHATLTDNRHPVKLLLSSLETDPPTPDGATLSMHLEESAGADIVYTCKPQFLADLMCREAELDRFRPNAIDTEPPAAVYDKLMRLPSFRRAIDPAGMSPDEFPHYGPFVANYAEVLQQTRRLVDFVARQLTTEPVPTR